MRYFDSRWILPILIIFTALFCLNTANARRNNLELISYTDTSLNEQFQSSAKKELKLVELAVSKDTLIIVSTNQSLYYPFGRFKTIDEFKMLNKYNYLLIHSKNLLSNEVVNVYQFSKKDNFVKIFQDDVNGINRVEILSGEIIDKEISLSNGVKIGMNKDLFLKQYFNDIPPNSINIVKMISGLEGIWHTYTFEKNKLTAIKFETDYMIEK